MTDIEKKPSIIDQIRQPSLLIDLPIYKEGKSIGQVLLKRLTFGDYIYIQKLSISETDKSFANDKIPNRDGYMYQQLYSNIAAKHFIFKCCYDPEKTHKQFFPTPDVIAKRFSRPQIEALFAIYKTFEESQP